MTKKSINRLEIIPISGKLRIEFIPKKQNFNLEIQKEIDEHWQESKNCFNGPLIDVIQFKNSNDEIYFLTQKGSYKAFIGTKNRRPSSIKDVTNGKYCMPLSVGTMVISSDDKIAVTKRTGTYLNNDRYSFPAEGYLDLNCVKNNEISIFDGIAMEMKEELGINELKLFRILGIVYDSLITKQPYIATIWETNLNSSQIKECFRNTEKKEFESIEFIENKKDPFTDFINKHELTLHNIGKAMLYASYQGWKI
ncbi:MAG TPA: hypothetical protein PKU93_02275 [Candidatus Pacearchaeota archaeon]|nr:hypothetical protein [Candidatus Pacearchaeota archaeon]